MTHAALALGVGLETARFALHGIFRQQDPEAFFVNFDSEEIELGFGEVIPGEDISADTAGEPVSVRPSRRSRYRAQTLQGGRFPRC